LRQIKRAFLETEKNRTNLIRSTEPGLAPGLVCLSRAIILRWEVFMTVSPERALTTKVLRAYSRIEYPRLRELVAILIRHTHSCLEEMTLTDEEWEFAWDFMARMAAITGPERNEFLLLADVIGASQLIETLNHEKPGQPVGFALVGPFFRAGAPFRKKGESTASDSTPGSRVRITGKVFDFETEAPIKDAVLGTWQAANNGLYENQDENQPDYNLRGQYQSDANGEFELVALMPTAYPVPTDGPVGELLRAAHRPPDRPAHIHFIVSAPGFETLVTQVFVDGDQQIEEDAVFTASTNMIGNFRREGDQYRLRYDFPLKRGKSTMPKAPIPS
jgi:catechol 1,2-dioxygenase